MYFFYQPSNIRQKKIMKSKIFFILPVVSCCFFSKFAIAEIHSFRLAQRVILFGVLGLSLVLPLYQEIILALRKQELV